MFSVNSSCGNYFGKIVEKIVCEKLLLGRLKIGKGVKAVNIFNWVNVIRIMSLTSKKQLERRILLKKNKG